MSIILKSLYYETKNKYKLKLIAGESGIDNVVSWFHFMEDESTINFIRGNELIVTTGLGSKNNNWLDNLIKGLIKNHVCGLIINIGQYIKTIPDHTISYCNENNFPLFIMPWEIHLVDIMQDYCDKIINAKQTASNISSAFFNAIYYPDNINLFKPPLKQEGYDLNGLFTIISLELESSIYSKTSEISLKYFIINIEKILNSFSFKYSILLNDQDLTIIINNSSATDIPQCLNILFNEYLKNQKSFNNMGVSLSSKGIDTLPKSFKEAKCARYIAIKDNKCIVYYNDIGLYKLLFNINNKEILVDLYNEYLGKLEEYDLIHKTDYLNILKLYINNNSSIQAVSEKTFTHRNTINYRIKKIKEILNTDLNNPKDKFNYMLAFYIEEMLNLNVT